MPDQVVGGAVFGMLVCFLAIVGTGLYILYDIRCNGGKW